MANHTEMFKSKKFCYHPLANLCLNVLHKSEKEHGTSLNMCNNGHVITKTQHTYIAIRQFHNKLHTSVKCNKFGKHSKWLLLNIIIITRAVQI